MKELAFMLQLNQRVAIYVPSTTNVDEVCDNNEMVQKTIRFLSEKFGGTTATKAVGGWVCENGKLVTEDVTIVYSFCTEQQLHTEAHALIEWCKMIKKEMKQEAVTLEVNRQVAFI